MDEIWKPIKGYEGLYEVSNMGRVKTLERIYYSGRNHKMAKTQPEGIRNTSVAPNGYQIVILMKEGKMNGFSVHSLVWDMFGDKPRTLDLQIDHIDENKLNNNINNLQLMTPKANHRKSLKRDLPVGVVPHGSRFRSQITKYGLSHYLGVFGTPEEAHEKYLWAEQNL